MSEHPDVRERFGHLIRQTLQPRTKESPWQWMDQHVVIPLTVGSTRPGLIDTGLTPPLRGLFDLYWQPHVHFFSLAKSARVGGTLFSIGALLHKVAVWPGPVLWVDPTRKTAVRFSRAELQPHMLECAPVAELITPVKTHWTTLEMILRNCTVGVVGAGSASELAGRQAELVVLNELDKFRPDLKGEAPPADLAIVRSKQFRFTRKILRNSTPTLEQGEIWQAFLAGSQRHCYVPCPHCGTPQRLTFFPERAKVPFASDGEPLPAGELREESTGRFYFEQCKRADGTYDLDKVERETMYECGACQETIEESSLTWMLHHYRWLAHNPDAPPDHESAHYWAAYSPFEGWGGLARKFLQARGSAARMHDFYNSDLGKPFKRFAATVTKDDIDALIAASPDYELRQLPFEPQFLTMTVDVQGYCFWWVIRGWTILWDQPDWPEVAATIDYGQAVSWEQIEQLAGLRKGPTGKWESYRYGSDGVPHVVWLGLIDAGFEAKKGKAVYDFCVQHRDVFNPVQGASRFQMRGMSVATTPVHDGQLSLVRLDDDHFKQQLYYDVLKERRIKHYLPRDIGADYRAQLTAERTIEERLPNGTTVLKWKVEGEEGNHLGDCEKYQEALRELAQPHFDALREQREAAMAEDR